MYASSLIYTDDFFVLEYVTICVYGKFLTTRIFLLAAPPYHSRHKVQATNWSYATTNEEDDSRGTERYVDLSVPPPYKPPPEGYKVSAKDFSYYSQSSKKLKGSRGSQVGKNWQRRILFGRQRGSHFPREELGSRSRSRAEPRFVRAFTGLGLVMTRPSLTCSECGFHLR